MPVKEDFSFDFDNISIIDDENIIGTKITDTKLYQLDFKMSDNDTSPKKFLWGDVHYEVIEGKELRYKTELGDKDNNSSFDNWITFYDKKIKEEFEKISKKIADLEANKKDFSEKEAELDKLKSNAIYKFHNHEVIATFRKSYETQRLQIETLLYNALAIEKKLRANNLKEINLGNVESLKSETVKIIFEQFNTDTNGKKKLLKVISDNNITTEELSWELIKDNDKYQENLLSLRSCNCFLHFDFSATALNKKYWYEANEILDIIYEIFIDAFAEKVKIDENTEKYVFNKTLYKTLCSGDGKNDIQFPGFSNAKKYKSGAFDKGEVSDLFYAIDYASRGFGVEDIKIIILPLGENLVAKDYDEFSKDMRSKREDSINNKNNASDDLLFIMNEGENYTDCENIVKFDVIFTKKGGATSPDVDLIELSGIQKSSLKIIKNRIKEIGSEIFNKRKRELSYVKEELKMINTTWAFSNILGIGQTDNKGDVKFKTNAKYQSHLLKTLPKIYSATYHQDDLLLPRFIENTEYSVRQGDNKYNFLKYDFEFLSSIQNTNIYKFNYMKILNSYSYKMGLLLGDMARNFAGESSPIKSFEKNYVGNLTRRIGRLEDFIDFKNDIEQKLIMHEKVNYTRKISTDLAELIKEYQGSYDKNECAFGFFESYFKINRKRTLDEDLKLLIDKHKDNKEQSEAISNLQNLLISLESETQI
ncbi:hypothetical protein [Emticicia aquatica]|uniref:hypothetical protein n=1 Tax=Emticicia aquatica TaxID=1681835 RepID=UPI001EECE311|nr:hypothetical protein [Emticicia aquatica]